MTEFSGGAGQMTLLSVTVLVWYWYRRYADNTSPKSRQATRVHPLTYSHIVRLNMAEAAAGDAGEGGGGGGSRPGSSPADHFHGMVDACFVY